MLYLGRKQRQNHRPAGFDGANIARNISKNTTIIIPEHKIPAFKPARVFMDEVKGE